MTGLASCFICPENYRAAKHRSISCQRCQSPYTSMHRGATNCSACIARFYLHTGTMKCEKCDDENSRCVATNGTTLATIDVKEGHYRFSKSSRVIYPCPNLGNCQGGVLAGAASCKAGSFGPLCELCRNGHYLEGDTEACESCNDAARGSGVITLFSLTGVVVIIGLAAVGILAKYKEAAKRFLADHKQVIDQLGAKITALIVTMQIIILVNTNHTDVEGEVMPEPYQQFLYYLRFLTMDVMEIVPVACIFGRVTQARTLMAWTVCPYVIFGGFTVAVWCTRSAKKRKMVRGYHGGLQTTPSVPAEPQVPPPQNLTRCVLLCIVTSFCIGRSNRARAIWSLWSCR